MTSKNWRLLGHQLFIGKFSQLVEETEKLDPHHPKRRLVGRIVRLVYEEIPARPSSPAYLLGNTLGPEFRSWRRAKFLGRFRLFFRDSESDKVIVYCWMNDENTLRKAGGRTDVYTVFRHMLLSGEVPREMQDLLRESSQIPPPGEPA